jgi:hypothetical protein
LQSKVFVKRIRSHINFLRRGGGQNGHGDSFYKTAGKPQCNEGVDLALQKPVKKFATDQEE